MRCANGCVVSADGSVRKLSCGTEGFNTTAQRELTIPAYLIDASDVSWGVRS
jgi:hypothetical protein